MEDPTGPRRAYPTPEQIEEIFKAWQAEGEAGIGACLKRWRAQKAEQAGGQESPPRPSEEE